jgi:hypothetical protein
MVEANHSLQEVALQARLAQATITLARQQAEKAVKSQLQRQGLKPRGAKKRKNLSSARHYDQIRFRFHTPQTEHNPIPLVSIF